jgi:hypothetical protein
MCLRVGVGVKKLLVHNRSIALLRNCNISPFSATGAEFSFTSHIRATLSVSLLNCCALGPQPPEMEAFDANYRRRG